MTRAGPAGICLSRCQRSYQKLSARVEMKAWISVAMELCSKDRLTHRMDVALTVETCLCIDRKHSKDVHSDCLLG